MLGSVSRRITALGVAISLCSGPAFASAAAPAPTQISPMVALSIFGSQASAAALCGSAVTTAASTAAASQAPGGGCVLPVVDAPPPVPVAEVVPVPPPGIGIAPILLALAGIAIFSVLIFTGDKDRPPISVN